MSGLLLDTHIWLWYAEGTPNKLSAESIRALDSARRSTGLWVSDLTLATRDAQILEYGRQGLVRTLAV